MPHCVIEYARPLETQVNIMDLCQSAHKAALNSGLFKEDDIKVRAFPCDHFLVGGRVQNAIHVDIYLIQGRSDSVKASLTNQMATALSTLTQPDTTITVDARDLNPEFYCKFKR